MLSVTVTCGIQGTGCTHAFRMNYDERLTPFYQEAGRGEWPADKCPYCHHVFRFARISKDPWRPGLVTVFE